MLCAGTHSGLNSVGIIRLGGVSESVSAFFQLQSYLCYRYAAQIYEEKYLVNPNSDSFSVVYVDVPGSWLFLCRISCPRNDTKSLTQNVFTII